MQSDTCNTIKAPPLYSFFYSVEWSALVIFVAANACVPRWCKIYQYLRRMYINVAPLLRANSDDDDDDNNNKKQQQHIIV